jgi:hypothetical protein
MPVAHAQRFVFFHIPKTAGVSITQALRRAGVVFEWDRDVSIWPHLQSRADNSELIRRLKTVFPLNTVVGFCEPHIPASVLLDLASRSVTAEYFKFAFVRNPWDLVVSTYHYLKTMFAEHERLGVLDPDCAYILGQADFDGFVRVYPMFASDQSTFLTDSNGQLAVDFIGRCESIDADFAAICRRIGVDATLGRENVTPHPPYRDHYTAETRAIVERHFAHDIERFGYEF